MMALDMTMQLAPVLLGLLLLLVVSGSGLVGLAIGSMIAARRSRPRLTIVRLPPTKPLTDPLRSAA